MAKPAEKLKNNGNGEQTNSAEKPGPFKQVMSHTLNEVPQLPSDKVQGKISTPEEALDWMQAAGFGDLNKLLKTAVREVKDPHGEPKLSKNLLFYYANELMERSRSQREMPKDGEYTDTALNMAVHFCGMAGKSDDAKQLFDYGVEQGFADIFGYAAMIEVFGDAGRIDEARTVFDTAVQKEKAEEVTHAAMMVAYGKAEDAKKAKEIFDMLGEKASVWTRLMMTVIYKECELVQEAEGVLGKTVEKGLVENDDRAVVQAYIDYK